MIRKILISFEIRSSGDVHAGPFNHFQFDRTDMVLLYKQPISASNLSSLSSVYLLFHFSPRLRVSYVKWNTHMTIRSLDKLNESIRTV